MPLIGEVEQSDVYVRIDAARRKREGDVRAVITIGLKREEETWRPACRVEEKSERDGDGYARNDGNTQSTNVSLLNGNTTGMKE